VPFLAATPVARRGGYRKNGDFDKAIADFNEAIRLNPKSAQGHVNRGSAYGEQGELDKAIAEYSEATQLNPKNAEAYINRGITYSMKGDLDKAIADCNEAIRISPNNSHAYYGRGFAYREKGDFDKAVADFTDAIRLDPKNTQVYCIRGAVYEKKGDFDKAITDFTEVIRLDPKDAKSYSKETSSPINLPAIQRSERYPAPPFDDNFDFEVKIHRATPRLSPPNSKTHRGRRGGRAAALGHCSFLNWAILPASGSLGVRSIGRQHGSRPVSATAGSVSSTSFLTAFRCFVFQHGDLGLLWQEKLVGGDLMA
jgi:Flp pilus assembly protein TadD